MNVKDLYLKFEKLKESTSFEAKKKDYGDLKNRLEKDTELWSSPDKLRQVNTKLKELQDYFNIIKDIDDKLEELEIEMELAKDRKDSINYIDDKVKEFLDFFEKKELYLLLDDEYDFYDAILYIHSGAGGVDAQDWAYMLFNMYIKWATKKNFNIDIADILKDQEGGIKSATFFVKGRYSYGFLKSETGVHRLVRLSPFDANHRRHTSFASVEVLPDLPKDLSVDIKDEDLKIDTFRSSGAGGQHVNKTSSAVRILHIPTGIVVQCQNERSQHLNKAAALKILKSKLLKLEIDKQKQELDKFRTDKRKIEWGSQIRSYVMHPYTLVKDLRTGFEVGDIKGVLEGNLLDGFIKSYLLYIKKTGR